MSGKRISQARRLRDRDEVTIGPIRLIFVDPDAELLDALKEVPGFEMEDAPAELDPDPSLIGSPGDESRQDAKAGAADLLGDEEADPTLAQDPDAVGHLPEEDSSAENTDTSSTSRRQIPMEWFVIGGVGVVILIVLVMVLAVVF